MACCLSKPPCNRPALFDGGLHCNMFVAQCVKPNAHGWGYMMMYTNEELCMQAVAAAVKSSKLLAAMWKHMRAEHAALLSHKQLDLMVRM